jgi:hypothetical protein
MAVQNFPSLRFLAIGCLIFACSGVVDILHAQQISLQASVDAVPNPNSPINYYNDSDSPTFPVPPNPTVWTEKLPVGGSLIANFSNTTASSIGNTTQPATISVGISTNDMNQSGLFFLMAKPRCVLITGNSCIVPNVRVLPGSGRLDISANIGVLGPHQTTSLSCTLSIPDCSVDSVSVAASLKIGNSVVSTNNKQNILVRAPIHKIADGPAKLRAFWDAPGSFSCDRRNSGIGENPKCYFVLENQTNNEISRFFVKTWKLIAETTNSTLYISSLQSNGKPDQNSHQYADWSRFDWSLFSAGNRDYNTSGVPLPLDGLVAANGFATNGLHGIQFDATLDVQAHGSQYLSTMVQASHSGSPFIEQVGIASNTGKSGLLEYSVPRCLFPKERLYLSQDLENIGIKDLLGSKPPVRQIIELTRSVVIDGQTISLGPFTFQ